MAGGVTVNGQDVSVSVTFQASSGKYLVWFNALTYGFLNGGLPNGTSWSVTVIGNTQTTEGLLLGFLVTSGTTAAYTIAAPTGYVVLPSAGNLTGYAEPTQSVDYETVSPGGVLAVAADPPALHATLPRGNGPAAASGGPIAAANRAADPVQAAAIVRDLDRGPLSGRAVRPAAVHSMDAAGPEMAS